MVHRTLVFLVVAALFGGAAAAAEPNIEPRSASLVSAEQTEKQVLEFLNEHHPELVQVLSNLHSNSPHEYDRAIRDLARVRERLMQVKEGDPQRHELDLQAWVVQSRIHLVVARLAMSDSPALRDELRNLLSQQFDLKLRAMRHDRQRQAERLRKLDEQIDRLAGNADELITKQMASLTKSSEAMAERIRDTRQRAKKGVAGGADRRPLESPKAPNR
ncbi:MAG: hypothetical protein KJ000_18255 [Pirellulaceae bacterium]|nr:hypothetical protein [Pirellulaceae bacterium]